MLKHSNALPRTLFIALGTVGLAQLVHCGGVDVESMPGGAGGSGGSSDKGAGGMTASTNAVTNGSTGTSTGTSGANSTASSGSSGASSSTSASGSSSSASSSSASSSSSSASSSSSSASGSSSSASSSSASGSSSSASSSSASGSSSSTGSGMPAVCGDGTVTAPEECDDANMQNGDGCDSCKFSCLAGDPNRNCTPADACAGQGVCSATTHTCSAGTPLPDGTSCGAAPNSFCKGGACTLALCGNGLREPNEQCDDGNTTNLDGCDGTCKFEQNQRVIYLEMLFGTDTFCVANRLGSAISAPIAQTTFQTTITQNVNSGAIDTLLKFTGLEDLTGKTNDTSLVIGAMVGTPVNMLPANGLDWWHTVDPKSIDGNRNPTASLPGTLLGGIFNAGPGTVSFFGLKATSAKLTIPIGASSLPLASTGSTPGHLASEHLDPALQSFATAGQPTSAGAGELCGNVSAASLVGVPIPDALLSGPLGPICAQGYSAANTLLDVIVGGCTNIFIGTLVVPTQPDTVDPGVPPGGAGGPYTLVANAQKTVNACRDKNGATVTLSNCLDAASYSSAFKFATQRVIVK